MRMEEWDATRGKKPTTTHQAEIEVKMVSSGIGSRPQIPSHPSTERTVDPVSNRRAGAASDNRAGHAQRQPYAPRREHTLSLSELRTDEACEGYQAPRGVHRPHGRHIKQSLLRA